MGILTDRRKAGAVCPACKSPNYKYEGRVNLGSTNKERAWWAKHGKHEFTCVQCGMGWQDGCNDSVYLKYLTDKTISKRMKDKYVAKPKPVSDKFKSDLVKIDGWAKGVEWVEKK